MASIEYDESCNASQRPLLLTEEKINEMRTGVQGFLKLRNVVSEKWAGPPTVLEELRKSRRHEAA